MKRCIVTLTTLLIIIAAGAFLVHADAPETVYCERCNQDVSEDNWQTWNFCSGDVAGGHYRLTDDYFGQTGMIRIPEDTIVCLDLCGYTYCAENTRMFSVAGTFTVMDSKGGGLILSTGENGKYAGFAVVQSSGSFKLYGGTIRYNAMPGVSLYDSALFNIDGGRVDIFGGTVAGGIAKATSSYNALGGNFKVINGGRLNVHGGTITQGSVFKSSSLSAQGSNIYASSGSKVVISGGVIENGYSDAGGGNIFIAEATLEITGGIIRNGHALVSGGNIMANADTGVVNTISISGGTVTGGVTGGTYATYTNRTFTRGSKGGGNIYERSPAGILNISGGTIDGDIVLDYIKTTTLSGAPKIGLGKNGGLIFTNVSTSAKANAKGLTDGAEIYVQANRVFTTAFDSADDANNALKYFKGALRTTLTAATGNVLQGTDGTTGYCPHCGNIVTWRNLNKDATFSGHCYLSDGLIRTNNTVVSNDFILDLNGYILHQENYRFIYNYDTTEAHTLTILDSWAGGKVQGTGTGNAYGGLLYFYPASTFDLLSGTLCIVKPVNSDTPTDIIVKTGGVIYADGNININITGGVITGGSVTATEGTGGNICMQVTAGKTIGKLNISAGIIKDGTATGLTGGNIYSMSPVEISGGVILGGKAKNGGSIYTASTCKITNGMIMNGNATNYGGNIYPLGGADISGGLIARGTATTSGGNLFVYKTETDIYCDAVVIGGKSNSRAGNIGITTDGTLHISGGLVSSGNATTRGGNIDTATDSATVNIDGGIVVMGSSASGGNIYINNGALNVTGGRIVAGKAENGGNIYLYNLVYAKIKDDGSSQSPLPCIGHGQATNGNGGNIYFTAADASNKYYLQLGNCIIRDGMASGNGENIYVSDKGVFKVLKEFQQSTTVFFHASRNPVKGELLTESITCAEGEFSGELRLENITPNPMICAENSSLRIIAAEIVLKDGTSLRFGTNEEAIRNYNDDAAYLLANAGQLVLTGGNYVVDVAGQNISVSGSGNITCFDSTNDSYDKFGTVTINGPMLVNIVQTVINNKNYVTVFDEGQYSFHRLDMRVKSISIRPGNAGVYYSSTWNCDTTLSSRLKHFGVAVSLNHMPNSSLMADKNVLYTKSEQKAFTVGKESNSVLISNILQNNNTNNDTRGRTKIYATPHITVADNAGQEHAVVSTSDAQAQYSLYDVMKLVDERISNDPINYRRLTLPMREFYEVWKADGMQTWNLNKIPAPAEDDVIDVLMIGSSFCYYYVEELYGIAEAAGVKMRVCNVYYSGCKFEWHYTWWKQGKSNYEFYQVTDNTGRKNPAQ